MSKFFFSLAFRVLNYFVLYVVSHSPKRVLDSVVSGSVFLRVTRNANASCSSILRTHAILFYSVVEKSPIFLQANFVMFSCRNALDFPSRSALDLVSKGPIFFSLVLRARVYSFLSLSVWLFSWAQTLEAESIFFRVASADSVVAHSPIVLLAHVSRSQCLYPFFFAFFASGKSALSCSSRLFLSRTVNSSFPFARTFG